MESPAQKRHVHSAQTLYLEESRYIPVVRDDGVDDVFDGVTMEMTVTIAHIA